MIDTHCHLQLIKDPKQAIQRAKQYNIEHIIAVSINQDDYIILKEFAKDPYISYTYGSHPLCKTDINNLNPPSDCIAIGETGLDFFREHNKHQQIQCFHAHMDIAQKFNKPVIIHTRNASKETIQVLKQYTNVTGVIHCFTEDYQMAKQVLDLNYFISFSGILTFKNSQDIQDVVRMLPIQSILAETDSPYLTPEPYRKFTNSPENVRFVIEKIANIKNISFEEACKITSQNARKLFKT